VSHQTILGSDAPCPTSPFHTPNPAVRLRSGSQARPAGLSWARGQTSPRYVRRLRARLLDYCDRGPYAVQFHVASYRGGYVALRGAEAFGELVGVLASLDLPEVESRRARRQAELDARGNGRRTAGIQSGLNDLIKDRLTDGSLHWRSQVPVFSPDRGSAKGFWTMDFHKRFPSQRNGVGIEVTFNHAEALAWTLIRPTLAHEASTVIPESRIDVGAIIIGTDDLKGPRRNRRMDSAVGTYERLRTLLPKMKWVLPVPLVIFGLDWAEGSQVGSVEEIDLHEDASGLAGPEPVMVPVQAVRSDR
jgi:hypothetical protein